MFVTDVSISHIWSKFFAIKFFVFLCKDSILERSVLNYILATLLSIYNSYITFKILGCSGKPFLSVKVSRRIWKNIWCPQIQTSFKRLYSRSRYWSIFIHSNNKLKVLCISYKDSVEKLPKFFSITIYFTDLCW